MSKKDYELIARALRAAHYRAVTLDHHQGIDMAANLLAYSLGDTNPRFDPNRFLTAAGMDNSSVVR